MNTIANDRPQDQGKTVSSVTFFNDFQVIPQMLMAQQQLMAIRTAQARMALVQQEVRIIVGLQDDKLKSYKYHKRF